MLTNRYGSIDVEWLQTRAAEIVAHPRFEEFEITSPYAAGVLREGVGRIFGLSLDAAVAEFDKFLEAL